MVEKINKTPEESKESEELLGEKEVKHLRHMGFLEHNYFLGNEHGEYTVGGETIRLERLVSSDRHGKVKKLEMSIRKFVPQTTIEKLKNLGDRRTTYKITGELVAGQYIFILETDDGYGHKDKDTFTAKLGKEKLEAVVSNFHKRFNEYSKYKSEERKEKEDRMQKLAYNDANEADDMLNNLDQFYNA